jgi:hypothetical protein
MRLTEQEKTLKDFVRKLNAKKSSYFCDAFDAYHTPEGARIRDLFAKEARRVRLRTGASALGLLAGVYMIVDSGTKTVMLMNDRDSGAAPLWTAAVDAVKANK